jgi:hypothetical protein
MATNPIPSGLRRDAQLPRTALFADLRTRWVDAKEGRSSLALCERLGMRKQVVTDYAHGRRHVPDWVLMTLCHDLGLELRLQPDGVYLIKQRAASPSVAVLPWG